MKTDFVFNAIMEKFNNQEAAESARRVVERLNFNDYETVIEICPISKQRCYLRLHNDDIQCGLRFWDNTYNFSFANTSPRVDDSIENASFDELIGFLEKHNFLNYRKDVIIENLKGKGEKFEKLLKNTTKVFNLLDDNMLIRKCDFFINKSEKKSGTLVWFFQDYKMAIDGNGIYELSIETINNGWMNLTKEGGVKFDEFQKIIDKEKLNKTKQSAYKDAELYILDIT